MPLTTTGVIAVTARAVAIMFNRDAPAGTSTLAGTDRAALLADSDTASPAAGAGPLSVTVMVTDPPARTDVAHGVSRLRVVGMTVTLTRSVTPLYEPEMVAICEKATWYDRQKADA
jgi:hypothetical protein